MAFHDEVAAVRGSSPGKDPGATTAVEKEP
jgi:hypothetical protein